MRNTKSINIILFIMLILLAAGSVLASGELRGAHKENEIQCADCHGTDTPDSAAKTSACLSCHGDYKALAELTKDVEEANPHDNHMGEQPCKECHGIHKPSKLFCNDGCHNFDMTVK